MTIADNESIRAEIAAKLMNHGMRPVPDKLIRDIIGAIEQAQSDAFECMAYDAHCPSMTMRFQVPEGFPLAGGIFRVQRVRTATQEDTARFAHLPDAPETFHDLPAQRDTLIAGEDSLFSQADFCLIGNTVENSEPTGGEAALIFNVSDNATAWSTPWVVGHWSDEAQRWFDHEGYPLTPSHVVKLPSAEVFEKAEGIKP